MDGQPPDLPVAADDLVALLGLAAPAALDLAIPKYAIFLVKCPHVNIDQM